jgi:hypothetical protein
MRPALALAALLLLATVATPSSAQKDCPTAVLNMQTACASLQPVFFGNDALPSVPFAAATDCGVLQAGAAALLPESALNPACCEAAREFAAMGCTCDGDVDSLLVGLGLLKPGAPAASVVKGIINLAQASACATDKYGGPMFEACSGGTGCGGAAAA